MLIKDVKLTKENIKDMINNYNENYDKVILRKNVIIRAVAGCSSKSDKTLI